MNPQLWWYVSRSSGIIAWVLLSLAVCWGLFASTRAVAKASAPAWTLDLHRFLGGASVIATALHLAGLVLDGYVEFGWRELFIPMASTWKPQPVAWGIAAFYLLIAVEVSSLLMRRIPRRWWRLIHHTSFGLWLVATVHLFQAGTDEANVLLRLGLLAVTNIVGFLTVVRVLAGHRQASEREAKRSGLGAAVEA